MPSRLLVVLGLLLAACAREPRVRATHRDFAPPFQIDPNAPTQLRVRADLDAKLITETLHTLPLRARLVGYGRVAFAPNASYAVRVPFTSFVDRVLVSVDDVVVPGQPLAELRSSEAARLRAELTDAQVALAANRQALARIERLTRDGTATERELSEARAQVQTGTAHLAGLRAQLDAAGIPAGEGDKYVLRATSAGRVLVRNVDPGERMSADSTDPAFLIGDPDRLVVRASFPERDAVWLDEVHACAFTVNAVGADRFDGQLSQIVRAVDPTTRSAVATCAPAKQDHRLAAEMQARVKVQVDGPPKLFVQRAALMLRRDETVAFVRTAPGVVERRHIETGLSLGDMVQVIHGLSEGEQVVVRNAVLLDGELDQLL